jgi:hypothetical protein
MTMQSFNLAPLLIALPGSSCRYGWYPYSCTDALPFVCEVPYSSIACPASPPPVPPPVPPVQLCESLAGISQSRTAMTIHVKCQMRPRCLNDASHVVQLLRPTWPASC